MTGVVIILSRSSQSSSSLPSSIKITSMKMPFFLKLEEKTRPCFDLFWGPSNDPEVFTEENSYFSTGIHRPRRKRQGRLLASLDWPCFRLFLGMLGVSEADQRAFPSLKRDVSTMCSGIIHFFGDSDFSRYGISNLTRKICWCHGII